MSSPRPGPQAITTALPEHARPREALSIEKPRRLRRVAQKCGAIVDGPYGLALLVLFLACYRITLTDTGHFAWGDEGCYFSASRFVEATAQGEYRSALGRLFESDGLVRPARPGFVLVSAVSVWLQRVVGLIAGVDPDRPAYYDSASAFNVLVTLGITCCVFALGRVWTGRARSALLVAVVYSLLVNSNMWIRHMMPYNESLLCFLFALWLLSSPGHSLKSERRNMVAAGLATALGYACYPGYYAFVLLNGVVVLARRERRIPCVVLFGLSSGAVMAGFEAAARLAGGSYLGDLRQLSGTIVMGSFAEGFVFLWHYLRDVEGVIGVVLFALFVGFSLLVLCRPAASLSRGTRVTMLAAMACYLFHAAMGVFGGKMVFYGRLLSMYLPFVVGGAVIALLHLRRPRLRRLATSALVVASAYSFLEFSWAYARIVYPADLLQETMVRVGRSVIYPPAFLWDISHDPVAGKSTPLDPFLVNVADPCPEGVDVYVMLASHTTARASSARFIGVNLKYFWYVRERYDRFEPPPGFRLIAEAPHQELFAAALYEGREPWERKRLRQRDYTMRIYERDDAANREMRLSKR